VTYKENEMMCYRDMSFCSDQDQCATSKCNRRFTDDDRNKAMNFDMPVAWMSFKATCGKYGLNGLWCGR